MFRRGPEVPIADRIAVVEQEMHELDQVCKGKKRKLKSVRSLGWGEGHGCLTAEG